MLPLFRYRKFAAQIKNTEFKMLSRKEISRPRAGVCPKGGSPTAFRHLEKALGRRRRAVPGGARL